MTEPKLIQFPQESNKPVDLELWRQQSPVQELRSGDTCPNCLSASLGYNALLILACEVCGYSVGGCFT